MSIPLPNLDDHRWQELVEEARALIPLSAPEWTDHNVHDPGITLIELFAWLTEQELYKINRIPESHKRKFLSLLGVRPRPPRQSLVVVRLALPEEGWPEGEEVSLPAATELAGEDPAGGIIRFRTLSEVKPAPGKLQAIQTGHDPELTDRTESWRRGEDIAIFRNNIPPAQELFLYLGFTQPLPRNIPVKLWFTLAGECSGLEERSRLRQEALYRTGVLPDAWAEALPWMDDSQQTVVYNAVPAHWEFLPERQTEWQQLQPSSGEIVDETHGFTLDGGLTVTVPEGMGKQVLGEVKKELYYLRCRFEMTDSSVAPVVRQIFLNGVLAEQAVRVHQTELGKSTGRPEQLLTLPDAPVLEDSFEVYSQEQGQWQTWERRPDFDGSTRADCHFVLNPARGEIIFGDGENGRVPPRGAIIFATYDTTRAEKGTEAAGRIRRVADSDHNSDLLGESCKEIQARITVSSVQAQAGAGAETLAEAVGRVLRLREAPGRAVTLQDYEILALQTPGVRLARAKAMIVADPEEAGVVTVVIVPPSPAQIPSTGMRQAVADYLYRRRIIGTRVRVIGPSYAEVAVKAAVKARAGVAKTELRERIEEALHTFLDPLRGGPRQTGWPFGRAVYRAEILQVMDDVPGVDHVESLELLQTKGKKPFEGNPSRDNVPVEPTSLVMPGKHQIEIVF